MPRCNGSYIGFDANPNPNAASGMWTVREAENYLRAGKWPATPTVPSAPTGLAGDQEVALTWTAPTGGSTVTDYIVQYSSNAGATWTTFNDGVSAATSATVTGLTNGTGYIFRIIAVNALGESPAGSASGTITPTLDPWLLFLASSNGTNSIAAYDWRDSDGSTLTGKVGPPLDVYGVTIDSEGGLFDPNNGTYAESISPVSVSYPFTLAVVAKAVIANESVLLTFGQAPPMTTLFGRLGPGLLPYNGSDNHYLGFTPSGQWYFCAVSFFANGTTRFYIKTGSAVIEGTRTAVSNPPDFTENVAFGKFFSNTYSPSGKILLGIGINQGFASLSAMESLYTSMLPVHTSVTSLQ